jgi:hypothetical protein
MKSIKKGKIILIYLIACLIYCIWLPTYIKTTTPKPTFSEYLAIQGISIDNFKSAMETLNNGHYGEATPILQVEARKLLGNDLGNKVRYEYKQLVVDFNGDIMTMNKIRQMSSGAIKGKYGTMYNNSGSNINDNL